MTAYAYATTPNYGIVLKVRGWEGTWEGGAGAAP